MSCTLRSTIRIAWGCDVAVHTGRVIAGGPRVLHVNDAASTTHQLLAEARGRGLRWTYLPLASHGRAAGLARGRLGRPVVGAVWLARLAAASAPAALLHVHGATVVRHTGWVPRPYVLHAHGTDVRSHQYDPAQAAVVVRALRGAAAVLYSTPDLAEHVLPTRPDALHVPQPLDLAALPPWRPPAGRAPLVVFASRWEAVKGLEVQLALAAALRAALPASVRVVGLDWGPGAARAAEVGVELLARRPRADYLDLLASASVVVGQTSGMLAASEVEAMGVGAPVVAALRSDWYPDDPPPVLGPSLDAAPTRGEGEVVAALVEAAQEALADPAGVAARLDGAGWVARHHDVREAVDRLSALYATLTPARRPAGAPRT